MKMTKKLVAMLATVVASIFGSTIMAANPWQTYEFEDDYTFYIDCLGENIIAHEWVTVEYRGFDSPSGNSHYIDHWTFEAEWIGEDTERVWLIEGKSPGSFQVMKGEVGQWTSRVKAIPFEGDGPMLMLKNRYKYTVDANGNLRVSYISDPDIRCLGPNH